MSSNIKKCGFGVLTRSKGHDYSSKDIVKFDYIKEVELKDSKNLRDFRICRKKVETSRISRQDFIQSYASDVGILNILNKVAKTGDISLLNQVDIGNSDVDLSKLPTTIGSAHLLSKKADSIYSKVPKDLKGKKSKEDFVESIDNEFISKYLDEKITKILEFKKSKEGESK